MEYKVFFGDIHIHSGFSGCFWRDRKKYGALDRIYQFARDKANLDFASITDHAFSLKESWEKILDKSYKYNNPKSRKVITMFSPRHFNIKRLKYIFCSF